MTRKGKIACALMGFWVLAIIGTASVTAILDAKEEDQWVIKSLRHDVDTLRDTIVAVVNGPRVGRSYHILVDSYGEDSSLAFGGGLRSLQRRIDLLAEHLGLKWEEPQKTEGGYVPAGRKPR